jgi:hypothetical protein
MTECDAVMDVDFDEVHHLSPAWQPSELGEHETGMDYHEDSDSEDPEDEGMREWSFHRSRFICYARRVNITHSDFQQASIACAFMSYVESDLHHAFWMCHRISEIATAEEYLKLLLRVLRGVRKYGVPYNVEPHNEWQMVYTYLVRKVGSKIYATIM